MIETLQQQVSGEVLSKESPGYEQIRRGWDLTIDHYPAYILIAHTPADIAAGLRFARTTGLGVAVQSTGHGMLYPADDSLLIISSRMKALQVDVKARTARVEAGVIWQEVLDASDTAWFGSIDGLRAPYWRGGLHDGWRHRLVGAPLWIRGRQPAPDRYCDGGRRTTGTAVRQENSDLFWAIPGGGGNFGVVTAMEFDLHPVPVVYGGSLVYPKESASRSHFVLYLDWIKTVPGELTSSISIMKFPSLEQIPEIFRGKTLVILMAAFAGSAVEGEQWLQPWLRWQAPISNAFREMPFSGSSISNDPADPMAQYGSSDMFDELSDDAIDLIVRFASDDASPLIMNVIRHAGGAMGRTLANANAIGNRDAALYLLVGGAVPDAAAFAKNKRLCARLPDCAPTLHQGWRLDEFHGWEW